MFRSARAAGLIGVCALAVACASAAYPTSGPDNPDHHWPPRPTAQPWRPTPAPWFQAPTAAPWFPTPTQAPYVDPVNFQDSGVNPFVDPGRDRYSTFGMDVDTASYAITRRFLEDGNMPDRDSVRLEEFVNAFNYGYEPPTDSAFAVHLDGGSTPFTEAGSILLRIGIQARQVSEAARLPASLTFVIDTSGSMSMDDRLGLVKKALGLLVSRLRPDDSVAIVQFGTTAEIVLTPTSAAEPEAILSAIDALTPNGSTNAQAGLELGYDVAALGHRSGAMDRVVLASDGVANVGLTDAPSLLERVGREVSAGVQLIAIGVGMGNFNDSLLEQLADHGNGFYAYVNDRLEAERVFGNQLVGTLQVVARDAKVQVEFRPEAVSRYRLLGYENRAIADQDFRDPYVDAGEVGAGHSVTALYEVVPAWTSDGFVGTVRLRWVDPATGAQGEAIRDIDLRAMGSEFFTSSASFRLAATVAAFAEVLRDSPYSAGYALADVAREAEALTRLIPADVNVSVFSQLTQTAANLDRGGW